MIEHRLTFQIMINNIKEPRTLLSDEVLHLRLGEWNWLLTFRETEEVSKIYKTERQNFTLL